MSEVQETLEHNSKKEKKTFGEFFNSLKIVKIAYVVSRLNEFLTALSAVQDGQITADYSITRKEDTN